MDFKIKTLAKQDFPLHMLLPWGEDERTTNIWQILVTLLHELLSPELWWQTSFKHIGTLELNLCFLRNPESFNNKTVLIWKCVEERTLTCVMSVAYWLQFTKQNTFYIFLYMENSLHFLLKLFECKWACPGFVLLIISPEPLVLITGSCSVTTICTLCLVVRLTYWGLLNLTIAVTGFMLHPNKIKFHI